MTTIRGTRSFKINKRPKEKEEWDALEASLRIEFWADHSIQKGDYFRGFAIKGFRQSMEDTMSHTNMTSLPESMPNLFGVFDGHGGDECALFLKQKFLTDIAQRDDLDKNPKGALADAFLNINEEFLESDLGKDSAAGSTATVLYISPIGDAKTLKYYCACVGDSRCIIINKKGTGSSLSIDHHLDRDDEYDRIEKGGGNIRVDPDSDEMLVYSKEAERGLNVTRSIGDRFFKPLVTSFPEVTEGNLSKDDTFFLLASDGVWAHVSNKEAARIMNDYGLINGLKNLANLANVRGCYDNCTVMGIDIQKMSSHFAKLKGKLV